MFCSLSTSPQKMYKAYHLSFSLSRLDWCDGAYLGRFKADEVPWERDIIVLGLSSPGQSSSHPGSSALKPVGRRRHPGPQGIGVNAYGIT